MSRASNEACLLEHLAAEGRHDMEATLEMLHPDCLFVDEPLGLRSSGRDGARRHYEMWWTGFGIGIDGGTLHWSSDNLVIGDTTWIGRHTGPFTGLAATHLPIRLPCVVFVSFQEGLLAGERFVYDLNGLLRQLHQPAFIPPGATR